MVADQNAVAFSKAQKVQGLHWMTALARLELGAMLSGFTEMKNPFHAVPPTKYDFDAYKKLLEEGWVSHVFGVSKIAKVHMKNLPKTSPQRNTLIIKNARRAKLSSELISISAAAKMFDASQRLTDERGGRSVPQEVASMQLAYDELQDYRDDLAKELVAQMQSGALNSQTQTQVSTKTDPGIKASYARHVRNCARGSMNRALANGEFTLTRIK